jgi:hypothetical protein
MRRFLTIRVLVVECWSAGVLECWSAGVLECWSAGVLECWSAGVLECWTIQVEKKASEVKNLIRIAGSEFCNS